MAHHLSQNGQWLAVPECQALAASHQKGAVMLLFRLLKFLGIQAGRSLWEDSRSERPGFRDSNGRIVAVNDSGSGTSGVLNGRGTKTTPEQRLKVGSYQLDFYFAATTRLLLIGANGEQVLANQEGSGTQNFSIETAGRYVFRLEPSDEKATWRVSYQKLDSAKPPVS